MIRRTRGGRLGPTIARVAPRAWRASRRVWWAARAGATACGLTLACISPTPADAQATEPAPPPAFFDPVISISPGMSREVDVVFDHLRADDGQLTAISLRLQYPVAPWLQLSLEVPIA